MAGPLDEEDVDEIAFFGACGPRSKASSSTVKRSISSVTR